MASSSSCRTLCSLLRPTLRSVRPTLAFSSFSVPSAPSTSRLSSSSADAPTPPQDPAPEDAAAPEPARLFRNRGLGASSSAVADMVYALNANKAGTASTSRYSPGARPAFSDRAVRGVFESQALASRGTARSLEALVPASLDEQWGNRLPSTFAEPLTTTTSRSISVMNGDVGLAFRRLNRVLVENNIKRELKQQDRFESGSDKRVRLNSSRHRRRYKDAVGKAVSLAMRMKA